MNTLTDAQWSYWAGVFDYSGSLMMRSHKDLRFPHIALKSCDKEKLLQLVKLFGGTIRNTNKQNTSWNWERTHSGAKEIILHLAPYLQVKTEELSAILKWQPYRRPRTPNSIPTKTRLVAQPW